MNGERNNWYANNIREITSFVNVTVDKVMGEFSRQFMKPAIEFARGSKIRKEGRAPYLHILKWLSESSDWSLDLKEVLHTHPNHKASVQRVLDKGFLEGLLNDSSKEIVAHFHYESTTRVLSVEDPKLLFFLRNLIWSQFTKRVGFTVKYFETKYDIALSFARDDRKLASSLFNILSNREVSVFYDGNEQHTILAREVEDYLAKVYKSEATYVVPFLSKNYPKRVWTKFESDQFRARFAEEAVIPIRFKDTAPGFFSEEHKYGALSFDPSDDAEQQLRSIADILCRRLEEDQAAAERLAEDAIS